MASVEFQQVTKTFAGFNAVDHIDISVGDGEFVCLLGPSGCGKTTSLRMIAGLESVDSGEIRINGQPRTIRSPGEAIAAGIGMVHQHFMLVEPLSVTDNVMLGAEGGPRLAAGARQVRARLAQLAADYGLALDPDAIVGDLPVGLQQRVEIVKALVRGGHGQTILPRAPIHRDLSAGELCAAPLVNPEPMRRLVLSSPTDRPLPRLARFAGQVIGAKVTDMVDQGIWPGRLPPGAVARP